MVTEAVANWFLHLVAGAVGLMPGLPEGVQSSLDTFPDSLASVVEHVGYFSPIVPFGQIAIALGITFAFIVLTFILNSARIVLSLVTLGGGAI